MPTIKIDNIYVVDGVRIVGFDNERGKGDRCHIDGQELPDTLNRPAFELAPRSWTNFKGFHEKVQN